MTGVVFTHTLSLATSDKCVLQLKAASNHDIVVKQILVTFNGNDNTEVPPLIHLVRQTDVGSGGTALTGYPTNERFTGTIQTTAIGGAFAGEPTEDGTPKRIFRGRAHPQSGLLVPLDYDDPIVIKGGGWLGLKINPADAHTCEIYIKIME